MIHNTVVCVQVYLIPCGAFCRSPYLWFLSIIILSVEHSSKTVLFQILPVVHSLKTVHTLLNPCYCSTHTTRYKVRCPLVCIYWRNVISIGFDTNIHIVMNSFPKFSVLHALINFNTSGNVSITMIINNKRKDPRLFVFPNL